MILKYHLFFKDIGIREGNKIALVGRNSATVTGVWCILATVTYGAVVHRSFPILNLMIWRTLSIILTRFMFADDKIFETLDVGENSFDCRCNIP